MRIDLRVILNLRALQVAAVIIVVIVLIPIGRIRLILSEQGIQMN